MTPGIWKKIGHIERAGAGLRIHARAFSKDTVGFIGPAGIRILLSPGGPAVDVLGVRTGIDGAEITEKIGYAKRSRSGKGITVSLIAAPEASGSWGGLMDLLGGLRERVNLSVLEENEPPFRAEEPVKATVNGSLYDGLDRRF